MSPVSWLLNFPNRDHRENLRAPLCPPCLHVVKNFTTDTQRSNREHRENLTLSCSVATQAYQSRRTKKLIVLSIPASPASLQIFLSIYQREGFVCSFQSHV